MHKIKFLKAESYYDSYLDQFYARRPHLKNASYQEQYTALMADCYWWADFWKMNLERSGKFEVKEIPINSAFLQKQWAKENGLAYDDKNWIVEILEAQIEQFQPDVLFIIDVFNITPSVLRSFRERYPFIKLIIGWDGIGITDMKSYEGYDLVLSCVKEIVNKYEDHGMKAYYHPLAMP